MPELKEWLCVDRKCLHADVRQIYLDRPIYASSEYTRRYLCLTIYCLHKNHFIRKYTTSCPHFQNTTLLSLEERKKKWESLKNQEI